jgi:hypothetical protein
MGNYLKVVLKFFEPECTYIRRASELMKEKPEVFVKTLFLDRFEEFSKELDKEKGENNDDE